MGKRNERGKIVIVHKGYSQRSSAYSFKPLGQKLGLADDDKLVVIHPPANYPDLLSGTQNLTILGKCDRQEKFIHYFASSKLQLEKDFPKLKKHLAKDGVLWVSNKKGQKDFNQNDVQTVGLKNGLVDIKIASVNDEWSAMKFVYRTKDR